MENNYFIEEIEFADGTIEFHLFEKRGIKYWFNFSINESESSLTRALTIIIFPIAFAFLIGPALIKKFKTLNEAIEFKHKKVAETQEAENKRMLEKMKATVIRRQRLEPNQSSNVN